MLKQLLKKKPVVIYNSMSALEERKRKPSSFGTAMEGKFSGEQVFMHRIRAPSKIKSF
jgi:hypothetical protein